MCYGSGFVGLGRNSRVRGLEALAASFDNAHGETASSRAIGSAIQRGIYSVIQECSQLAAGLSCPPVVNLRTESFKHGATDFRIHLVWGKFHSCERQNSKLKGRRRGVEITRSSVKEHRCPYREYTESGADMYLGFCKSPSQFQETRKSDSTVSACSANSMQSLEAYRDMSKDCTIYGVKSVRGTGTLQRLRGQFAEQRVGTCMLLKRA